MTRLPHAAELDHGSPLPGGPAAPGAPPAPGPNLDPDEELLALPAPPRRERLLAFTLMAAVSALALGLGASLRADVGYLFADRAPLELGRAPALDPSGWPAHAHTHARVQGAPMLSQAVRYRGALGANAYVAFPLAGQRNLLVQVPAAAFDAPAAAARTEFAGRLVRLGELGGRYARVARYLREPLGLPITADTYLLMADEPPASALWAGLLFALCLAVVALNLWLLLRWFRPLRW